MAPAVGTIEVIGRVTALTESIDSLSNFGGDKLDKLNSSAQLAAAGAGLVSSINPGAAISESLFAADVQIAKFYNNIKSGAGLAAYAADIVGFIGDIAVIGGGVSTFVGAPAVGATFGALGSTTDISGIALNHPDQVVDAVDFTQRLADWLRRELPGFLTREADRALFDDLIGQPGVSEPSGDQAGSADGAEPAARSGAAA